MMRLGVIACRLSGWGGRVRKPPAANRIGRGGSSARTCSAAGAVYAPPVPTAKPFGVRPVADGVPAILAR
jgi:hypothetical protein